MKKRFIFIVAICTLAMCFTACPIIADPVPSEPLTIIGTWTYTYFDGVTNVCVKTFNQDGTYTSDFTAGTIVADQEFGTYTFTDTVITYTPDALSYGFPHTNTYTLDENGFQFHAANGTTVTLTKI